MNTLDERTWSTF